MASVQSVLRLYKEILRQHRYALPPKHRELGDRYVRSEFRSHKNATAEQVDKFMEGWKSYLEQLRHQGGQVGRPLSQDEAASLNNDQRDQLFRLKQQTAASGATAIGDISNKKQ